MKAKQSILNTVGLWGIPVDRFRVFKVGVWHVVWPNEMFARTTTADYEQARQTVVAEIQKRTSSTGLS